MDETIDKIKATSEAASTSDKVTDDKVATPIKNGRAKSAVLVVVRPIFSLLTIIQL